MMGSAPSSQGLLSCLKPWLDDPKVCEIMLNTPQEIFVEREGSIATYHVPALNKQTLYMLFGLLARENKQQLHAGSPLMAGSLQDGSRIQLVVPPVSHTPVFSIRRQVATQVALADFQSVAVPPGAGGQVLDDGSVPLAVLYRQRKWPEMIAQAVLAKKNIVISGGTSTGKTTFLMACMAHIPKASRVIVLEDTREIDVRHPNHLCLATLRPGPSGPAVSMQHLLQCSLRLRPDRLVMGEIRGAEMMDFVAACSTGHAGALTTVHANSPRLAIARMRQLYKLNPVPAMTDSDIDHALLGVIDVVVQLERSQGQRSIADVALFESSRAA